jgi:hypothetical protein
VIKPAAGKKYDDFQLSYALRFAAREDDGRLATTQAPDKTAQVQARSNLMTPIRRSSGRLGVRRLDRLPHPRCDTFPLPVLRTKGKKLSMLGVARRNASLEL